MKKSGIHIFLLICVVVCVGSFFIGYMLNSFASKKQGNNMSGQNQIIDVAEEEDEEKEEEEETSLESLNVLNAYEYVLVEEDGYVAVYYADKKTLYSETDIRMESLPEDLQEEIKIGLFIYTVEELYNFLESHTS